VNPKLWGRNFAVALLIAAFAYSGSMVWKHHREDAVNSEVEVIRLAHWQLEPGMREAFDAIIADYEALHPNVRVKQVNIPGRVWRQWLRTQLVGGNPPDLIEVANYLVSDEMFARYFVPLTSYLEEPNHYNSEEPDLRESSWRESFVGELVPNEAVHYYSANLLEYYAVPNAMMTVRVFYNRDLMKELIGSDRVPETFAEFTALCEALKIGARKQAKRIQPLAGSIFNTRQMTASLARVVTQNLAIELDYNHDLDLTMFEGNVAYLRDRWSYDTPVVRQSLELIREVCRYMSPGWVQMKREDAMLQFLQGQAAMLATGTWDASGILQQAQFNVGIFQFPEIDADNEHYGEGSLGPISESNTFGGVPMALSQTSKHPERAIDFLRYLTSRRSNTKFSETSNWLPVIKGVPIPQLVEAFRPIADGYIPGLSAQSFGQSPDKIYDSHVHLLSGERASVEAYVEATRELYPKAIRRELNRMSKTYRETIRQKDSVMAGLHELEKDGDLARSKFDIVAAKQIEVEALLLQAQRTITDYRVED